MSNFNPQQSVQQNAARGTPHSTVGSEGTVSGIPLLPVYAPPLGHDYQTQQQFPPPIPQPSLYQYGAPGCGYKPTTFGQPPPLPPSIYYSRYPTPSYAPSGHPPVSTVPQSLVPVTPLVQPVRGPVHRQLQGEYNAGRVYTAAFDDAAVRDRFVKNVLVFALLHFACGTALSAVCLENSSMHHVVEVFSLMLWISIVACVFVILFVKLRSDSARRPLCEWWCFVAWSIALVVTFAWITALTEVKFLLVLQLLISFILASLLLVSTASQSTLLTGRSLICSGFVLVFVIVPVGIFYAQDSATMFFGVFLAMLAVLYMIFRLHYMMGDEWRKLQPHEIRTAAMTLFF